LPATTTYDSGLRDPSERHGDGEQLQRRRRQRRRFASGVVSGTLSDIAAGVTRTLVFRVTVN
jgi:hypothetical protein